MTIAEKLIEVAEKIPEVYNSGVSSGITSGIETGKAEAYEEIEHLNNELEQTLYGTDTGGKSQYDIFWDNLQQNGTRSQYVYTFAYTGWNDKIFNPKYPITPTSTNGIGYIFQWNQQITDTKVPITAFGNCSHAFYQTAFLKRIPKLIFNGATNVSNMFYKCNALEELNAEGELTLSLSLSESSKLNKTSIESLVNVLSSTTSGLTLTLSQVAVNNAFTDAEWAELIATKSNWTINLI